MKKKPVRRIIKPLTFAIACALSLSPVAPYAASVTWQPDSNGSWGTPANWSSNPLLPRATDDVGIDVGGTTVRTITHNSGTNTINSLTSQENLVVSGGSLTIANAYSRASTRPPPGPRAAA